jgi:hypothetical protein
MTPADAPRFSCRSDLLGFLISDHCGVMPNLFITHQDETERGRNNAEKLARLIAHRLETGRAKPADFDDFFRNTKGH